MKFKVNLQVTGTIESDNGDNPEPPLGFPNQPAHMTQVSDYMLDDTVEGKYGQDPLGDGWIIVNNHPPGTIISGWGPPWDGSPYGWALSPADNSAPYSPPSVVDYVYPVGMVEGHGPCTIYRPVYGKEGYFGFYWKVSDPFDYCIVGTKICFFFCGTDQGDTGQEFLSMGTNGLLHAFPEFLPPVHDGQGVMGKTFVTLGVWHLIEWYTNIETGKLKVWMDNKLEIEADYFTNPGRFVEIKVAPTLGGNNGGILKLENHYYYDHFRVALA
jgi:hypothetical protein